VVASNSSKRGLVAGTTHGNRCNLSYQGLNPGGLWLNPGGLWLNPGGLWLNPGGLWLNPGGLWLAGSDGAAQCRLVAGGSTPVGREGADRWWRADQPRWAVRPPPRWAVRR